METHSIYNRPEYSGLCSSAEILDAIEGIAADEFLTDDGDVDDSSDAYRIWAEPTDAEIAKVVAMAWTLAAEDEESMRWGVTRLSRPD